MGTDKKEKHGILQEKGAAGAHGSRPRSCNSKSQMKLFILSLAALAFALGLTLSNVGEARSDGNESHGGGTENFHPTGPAWFMGKERTIRACVIVKPDFRLVADTWPATDDTKESVLTKQNAERLLREAFGKWAAYIKERVAQSETSLKFAIQMDVLPSCDANADLRVYFGAVDGPVKRERAKFKEPFGFAINSGKPESLYWRKGIIWIAPPGRIGDKQAIWTQRRLVGELLHEIGHTYGNSHVPGTVMDETLSETFSQVPSNQVDLDFLIDQIDQERALVHGSELQKLVRKIYWKGVPDRWDAPPGASVLDAFHKVMKRSHQGNADASVEYRASWHSEHKKINGTYSLGDLGGQKTFSLEAETPFKCVPVERDVFVHYIWKDSDYQNGTGQFSETCQYLGKITDKETGESFAVAINEDADSERFLMSLTDGDYDLWLFHYQPPWDQVCEWVSNPNCGI